MIRIHAFSIHVRRWSWQAGPSRFSAGTTMNGATAAASLIWWRRWPHCNFTVIPNGVDLPQADRRNEESPNNWLKLRLISYCVYILSSKYKKTYIGVTNNLERRLYEHKNKLLKSHTAKYNIDRLVYFEVFSEISQAITRETVLKSWRRKKKVALIEGMNPEWKDLSELWG